MRLLAALSAMLSAAILAMLIGGATILGVVLLYPAPPEQPEAPSVLFDPEGAYSPCEEGDRLIAEGVAIACEPGITRDNPRLIEADRKFAAHLNRCFRCAKFFEHTVEAKNRYP